jgi:anti-sigma regulatory factor (Ser/Thr protein kinase)
MTTHSGSRLRSLTFSQVKELGFQIAESKWISGHSAIIADSSDLGPLIELLKLLEANNLAKMDLARLIGRTRTLEAVLLGNSSGSHYALGGEERSVGIMRCEGRKSEDKRKVELGIFEATDTSEARWRKFADALEVAAQSCGLSKRMAQGIAGVVQELQDNIFEHSYSPNSGTLGFRRVGNAIEIVVADAGVGVLGGFERLSSIAFDSHEEALRAVVYEQRSRFNAKDGHGSGLRQIFAQLATLHGNLRFRTGDVSLSISGNNFTIDNIVIADEPFLPGFLIHFAISPRGPA